MFSEGGCGIWGDKCYESVSFGEVCDKLKGLACAFKEKKLGESPGGDSGQHDVARCPVLTWGASH